MLRPVLRFCRLHTTANSNAADLPCPSKANSRSRPSRCSGSGSNPASAARSATSGPSVRVNGGDVR